jgi:hypothetical protein
MIRITNGTGATETHEYFYQVRDVVKMLKLRTADGKLIGQNNGFKVFKYNGILCADGTPKQSLLNLGLAISHRTMKRYKTYAVTMFSEQGLNYLKRQFETQKFIVYYEPTIRRKKLTIDDVC